MIRGRDNLLRVCRIIVLYSCKNDGIDPSRNRLHEHMPLIQSIPTRRRRRDHVLKMMQQRAIILSHGDNFGSGRCPATPIVIEIARNKISTQNDDGGEVRRRRPASTRGCMTGIKHRMSYLGNDLADVARDIGKALACFETSIGLPPRSGVPVVPHSGVPVLPHELIAFVCISLYSRSFPQDRASHASRYTSICSTIFPIPCSPRECLLGSGLALLGGGTL